ncbi:MAG: hypothetical protein KGL45_00785, partial [Gammaproteobacteria bacterium]|nr:hypothetical protein [Gammaproteobacteria bacterium]
MAGREAPAGFPLKRNGGRPCERAAIRFFTRRPAPLPDKIVAGVRYRTVRCFRSSSALPSSV